MSDQLIFTADVQGLNPGDVIQLFEIDCTSFGGDVLFFHGTLVKHTPAEVQAALTAGADLLAKSIWWRDVEYKAWPVKIEGLDITVDGPSPRPTMVVGNLDSSITALCLQFQDLKQARITVRDTFAHYLDAQNFEGGNADADPTQERIQYWDVDRKSDEDDEIITFELASPADSNGLRIPARIIHSMCEWCLRGEYRGADCGYVGGPVSDADGNPTDDPAKDDCGGLLSDCKARWGANNPLPHGGFPGSALLRS